MHDLGYLPYSSLSALFVGVLGLELNGKVDLVPSGDIRSLDMTYREYR
jgi:hypothetical protein